MAAKCSRIVNRTSISSLKSALKKSCSLSSSADVSATTSFPSFTNAASSPLRRFSLSSRIPSELGAVQSMLPLHSAVAAARMTSCLSTTSRSCRALSQDEYDGT